MGRNPPVIVARWRRSADTGRRELEVRDPSGDVDILWYEFDGDAPPSTTDRMEAAAVALHARAMRQRVGLHLEGQVDASLVANLAEYARIWSRWRRDLFRPVEVTADHIDDGDIDDPPPDVGALGFSGGVDSCYALAANARGALELPPVELGVAVLVHGFDVPLDDHEGFAIARKRAQTILADFGVPLMSVRTNWRDAAFCTHWTMTCMAGLAAVLHQLSDRAGFAMVASDGVSGREVLPWGSNSITNPLLGSGHFPLRTVGLAAGRSDRCQLVAEWESIRDGVRSCYSGVTAGSNCGTCGKCITTKLNFLAAGVGEIPALGSVTVREVRTVPYGGPWRLEYLREIAAHRESLPADIRRWVRVGIVRHRFGVARARLRRWLRPRARMAELRRQAR